MSIERSEQELVRRESLKKLRELGVNCYPAELYNIDNSSKNIKETYNDGDELNVVIAGRLMSRRIMGKASFAELQDSSGRIQLYVNRDEICEGEDKTLYNQVFKKLLDIGDIVGVKGYVFKTKVGETSVMVKDITLLSKSLKPLPLPKSDSEGNLYDAFTDPEKRYRQRYIDLVVNPEVKKAFVKRTQLTNSMREFLNNRDYMEVELQYFSQYTGVPLLAHLKHTIIR